MDHDERDERHDRRESCDNDVCTSCGYCCGSHHETCEVPMSDDEVRRTLEAAGVDSEVSLRRMQSRVSEFEKMREERDAARQELGSAIHNETETATLLAEAREHIKKLQGSIDHLTKQVVPLDDLQAERLGREITRLAAENERLEVEALRWHGEATKQERISEMYAKASIDAQEISLIDRDEREAAVEDRDRCGHALRDLLAAFLHEAAQGDGVSEEFVPRVEAAKAALASLPLPKGQIIVKPRPVPICGACNGPLVLDADDLPLCPACGPVRPR